MTTLLTLIIFFIYIGLGLPDSSVGASWPAVFADLNIKVGYQSVVTVIISLGTVIASFFSASLIKKLGTPLVTALSTFLTALALLGFSISPSLIWICVCSIPLGFGAGAIDAALNGYVANRYSAFKMNLLHCFYGIGVTLTPYVFSLVLKNVSDWRTGFFLLFLIQALITVISFASFPLWKKADQTLPQENQVKDTPLSFKTMVKMPLATNAWLVFFATCALEFVFGTWGCTFLVKQKGLSESQGAFLISFYYVGITLGRILSGVLSKKLNCGKLLTVGYTLAGIGVVLTFLPMAPTYYAISLILVGLGNGPTFPNLTHATPEVFGKQHSNSIIGMQMTFSNLGILLIPPLSGLLFQEISFNLFPVVALGCFLLMAICTIRYQLLLKSKGKSFFNIN